jgi:uncharacterized Zn finger protein
MQYECPECGYTELRSIMISTNTPDTNAKCPDCERVRLKPIKNKLAQKLTPPLEKRRKHV